MDNPFPNDFHFLVLPALLFVYYMVFWFLVGRDPRIENVTPQYDPPVGVSPGVARYILTGGSDGTTLAAVLSGLAAKGVISIQPEAGRYQLELLNARRAVAPDEAAIIRTLFNVESPVEPYAASKTAIAGTAMGPDHLANANVVFPGRQAQRNDGAILGDDVAEASAGVAVARLGSPQTHAVVDPASPTGIKYHIDAIQDTFRKNLQGTYFRQNFIFAGIGALATFTWGLTTALFLDAQSSLFITFWLLMFTSIAGLVIGGIWTSKPTRPTVKQRISRAVVPILFFALPGAMIYFFAMPHAHGFVLALLLSVLLNNVFFVLMRAPTALGRATLQQLAGFREFLVRVEQDRLERANTPAQRAELMNRFLPYAIALGVREGWGDTMAAAFSDAIVER